MSSALRLVRDDDQTGGPDVALSDEWTGALEDFAAALFADGRRQSTFWNYQTHLRRLAAAHPDPWAVQPADLTAFLGTYSERTATSQKQAMVAVRSFYAWAYEVGRVESDPAARAAGRKIRPHDGFPKRWRPAIAHYVAAQRVGEKTLRLRLGYLRRFASEHDDPWEPTPDTISAWVIAHPGHSAQNGAQQALRSFYAFAYTAGLCGSDPAAVALPRQLDGHQVGHLTPAWRSAIEGWVTFMTAAGIKSSSIRVRRAWIGRLACDFPNPAALTEGDVIWWLAAGASWAAETRHSAAASVRTFYRWACRTGVVETPDPTLYLPTIRVPRGRPRPTPTHVLEAATAAATDREKLMLALAAFAGLRRAEIACVHPRDFIDGVLHVTGKGGAQRIVPVHPLLAALVDAELGRRRQGVTGSGWRYGARTITTGDYLFPGQEPGTHVQPWVVGDALSDLLGDAWTGHTLRHRFASRAYAANRDIRAVQELLGHASPITTARYTAVPDNAMRDAVLAV